MSGGESGAPLEAAPSFDYESKRWGAAPLRARPRFMNGLKLRYLLEDLAPVSGSVLDVGCGAGQVAKAVKEARPDLVVHGCDISESALAVASAGAPDVDFRLATAERLPFADGEMDFVWIFDVLEHVEDPGTVLREVHRVLKPGGGFHIVLPLEGQPRTLYTLIGTGTRWTAKVRHGGHIQIFSSARYEALAASCGLPVQKRRWSYHGLLHTFRNQRAWHGRAVDQQFRRFIRSVSERNSRYIRAIVETIEPSRLPRPLRLLLDYVEPS